MSRLLCLLSCMLCLSSACRADIYLYYPQATLRLGQSFDPSDMTRVTPECFDYRAEQSVDGFDNKPVASDVRFSIHQVTDSRELHSLLRTSVSMAGHYAMFSADGGVSSSNQLDTYENAMSWVLTASSDFGRFEKKNLRLNDESAQLLKRDATNFLTRCGTDVVLQVTRGINISVIFTLNNSASAYAQDISADFNASVGGNMWGASASASFSQSLKKSIAHGDLSLNVIAVGGTGASGLSDLINQIKDQTTIGDVKNVLAAYTKSLSFENSAITSYRTGPIVQFAPSIKLPSVTLYNYIITEYFYALNQNINWATKARDVLAAGSDFPGSDLAVAKSAFDLARSRTVEIALTAQKCRDTLQDTEKKIVNRARVPLKRGENAVNMIQDAERALRRQWQQAKTQTQVDIPLNEQSPIDCPFHNNWIDFQPFEAIPSFPFKNPVIWTDPLGQAPSNFLFVSVEGASIASAKLVAPFTGQDVMLLSQANSVFSGMYDTNSAPNVRPIDLIVLTKSGRQFSFTAWK